jgi:ABC-type sugar transport system substrate-binding protein
MSRRRVAAFVAVVAAVTASAVSLTANAGAKNAKTVNIAYFAPLANSYVQGELAGIAGVLKKNPNVKLTKVDTGFDPTKQYNSVQDAITQNKFQGFIVLALDSVGLVPAVQQAIKAGIKVVNADTPLGPLQTTVVPQVDGETGTVFDPWTLRGVWGAQLVIKACKGVNPCKVGWMSSVAALPAEKAYHDTAMKLIKAQSNIQVVAEVDGGAYTVQGGQKTSQDLLTAHPDLNVLVAVGDQPAAGAVLSIDSAGLAGKVKLIGGCPSRISKPLIKSGKEWGSWACFPADEGALALTFLLNGINGKLTKPAGASATVVALRRLKLSPLITKENIDKYPMQYSGS